MNGSEGIVMVLSGLINKYGIEKGQMPKTLIACVVINAFLLTFNIFEFVWRLRDG